MSSIGSGGNGGGVVEGRSSVFSEIDSRIMRLLKLLESHRESILRKLERRKRYLRKIAPAGKKLSEIIEEVIREGLEKEKSNIHIVGHVSHIEKK